MEGVANGTFPGAVGAVGDASGFIYSKAVGSFTYGSYPPQDPTSNPEVTLDSRFDMASLSKVVGATTAGAVLYQKGYFHILDKVSDYLGDEYNSHGKEDIRIVNLLTHDAGYPPDPVPGYWEPSFGCAESQKYHPAENFECNERIYKALLNQTLENPVGVKYVYSDLSFITMHYVLGSIVYNKQLVPSSALLPSCASLTSTGARYVCHYEAYVRQTFTQLNMPNSGFLPPQSQWSAIPPTRNDTWYRHAVSQGTVDDENAYALGGISGHAGIFSNAEDLKALMEAWLYRRRQDMLNDTTIDLWTKEYNHNISCRALGWSTNDQTVPDRGWDGTCGHLSSLTFLHVGYTGTQICADPVRKQYTLLLTNRVFPTGANIKIQAFRRAWNDLIVKLYN